MINTEPELKSYDHQIDAINTLIPHLYNKGYAALYSEQGTGKSRIFLRIGTKLYKEKHIQATLIIAPNEVHVEHALKATADHIDQGLEYCTAHWRATPRKWEKERLKSILDPIDNGYAIFTCNIESIRTPKAKEYINKFFKRYKDVLVVIDESHGILDPKTACSQAAFSIAKVAKYRLISTGTFSENKPTSGFSQLWFLSPSLLGFSDKIKAVSAGKSFVKKYSIIKYIPQPCVISGRCDTDPFSHYCKKCKKVKFPIPMVVGYRRLDQLKKIINSCSYSVLQKDCVSLPDRKTFIELVPMGKEQSSAYHSMKDKFIAEIKNGIVTASNSLDSMIRLQQISSGIYKLSDESEAIPFTNSPKMDRLISMCKSISDSSAALIWCMYKVEVREITKRLRKEFGDEAVMMYYGDTSADDRQKARTQFEKAEGGGGKARFLVCSSAANTGLTLNYANYSFYHSLDPDAVKLSQSKFRNLRIGQTRKTFIYHLQSKDTIDEKIFLAHQDKRNISNMLKTNPVDFFE